MNFIEKIYFSENFYRKLGYSKVTLFIGIFLVGLKDIGVFIYSNNLGTNTNNIALNSIKHSVVALLLICIFGLIDVLFYSLPVYDVFKHFPPKENFTRQRHLIVVIMKVYIIANLVTAPIDVGLIFLGQNKLIPTESSPILLLLALIMFASYFWYIGIIIRGVNVVLGLVNPLKKITVILNLIWIIAMNYALNYLIDIIVPYLFKLF